MSKCVLVNRLSLTLAFVGALALTAVHGANAETKIPAQFAVKTTSGLIGAPVRTANFSGADRQNVKVQPVHFGRGGWYGGNYYGGRGYAGLNYGYRPYGGVYRGYNFGYQPLYVGNPGLAFTPYYNVGYTSSFGYAPYNVGYAPYNLNRPWRGPNYGYGSLYTSYYQPYYRSTYFRQPYYAAPVYYGYPQNVYYAPSFASYGNCYYW